jgi:arylsulfatase A-like enzyme
MGSPGPFRGELGDASEGSIRTAALIRWPGRIGPRSSYAMFSTMDFFPTLARLAGGKVPNDRPIDGIDQTDLVLGGSGTGRREALLTFVGPELVAVRVGPSLRARGAGSPAITARSAGALRRDHSCLSSED